MRPKIGVVSWHGTLALPELTSQTLRICVVPGVRFGNVSMTTLNVTSNVPPTGSAPPSGSRSRPAPSSGNAVPTPSSGTGVVTFTAFLKVVLPGTYVVSTGTVSRSVRSVTGARLMFVTTIV